MNTNPLKKLESLGQSIWIDFISRDLIKSGRLLKLIREDGLRGMTSNPTIFEKAISSGEDYDKDILEMAQKGMERNEVYEALSQQDIRDAADIFRQVYDKTNGKDGFVSLEVNPHLAYDTKGTVEEARRLWKAVDRPNILIKVPGTAEGLPAIRQLISDGINVNVTLLFGLPRYREVVDAYLGGIEKRIAQNKPVDHVVSVASFFLSRIDVLVDPRLEEIKKNDNRMRKTAEKTHGEVAVASAREAYIIYKEYFSAIRFKKMAEQGAHTQRLLWASTSTKNPEYSDVKYVEPLIGQDTVNTMPPETIDAYRDHGRPEIRIENDPEHSREILQNLSLLGINIDEVTSILEQEGVDKFIKPFDKLMETLNQELNRVRNENLSS